MSGEFEPEELPPKEGEEEKAEATSSESKEEEGKFYNRPSTQT